ncbi:competence damage inducible protein CinA [Legionella rubrilucens]|uniref:Competence damage inducible protein CinA n=1 Tax=Legionella rubrilucens TaxID=458 RepID=A0A0W0XW11_9GAMM|nr:competence/damage-inducible protein A [Legionella rubrilucens]KTD48544.1 competence damage inducible protein CinA [Legionella rubrilucens]
MTAALLATGDEIVIGDTLNTNGQQIAHALHAEGLALGLHMTCGDDETQIYQSLSYLASQHDIILITGGLGPTSDDRTRYALARLMGVGLEKFPEALEHIQKRLRHSALSLSTGNQQQALFPPGATLLPNPNGTAMGCYCYWQNKLLILLPGPPRECLPMFNQHVLPLLQTSAHTDKTLLKWRVFGVAESQIAQQIDEAVQALDCETGYRLETPYVECKVRCRESLVEKVRDIIEPIVAPHTIATTEKKASEALCDLIIARNVHLSIQDDATGGVLQRLLQQPENYPLLAFNSQTPQPLHFHITGLEEYWHQQDTGTTTEVRIAYTSAKRQGQECRELPYRSPLVVHIAAEWLSFRLFHLINELHEVVT